MINNQNKIMGVVYAVSSHPIQVNSSYTKIQISLKIDDGERNQFAMFDLGNERMHLIKSLGIKVGDRVLITSAYKGKPPLIKNGELVGYTGNEVIEISKE